MRIRRIETDASVWFFDIDRMMYVRFPRGENPDQRSQIRYTGAWEPFLALVRVVDGDDVHLEVTRPVPYGTGRHRRTGVVLVDTHPDMADIWEGVVT